MTDNHLIFYLVQNVEGQIYLVSQETVALETPQAVLELGRPGFQQNNSLSEKSFLS